MAKQQRKVKPALKRKLIEEAGSKCANPGCSNWRTHIHHIKHWAVYKAHDAKEMIAICPTCHDSVHHGQLEITDETLYVWKGIKRTNQPSTAYIYVEPAKELKLLTGSVAISTTNTQQVLFELSNNNKLELRILDKDILQITSSFKNQKGQEVLRVVENHVKVHLDKDVRFEQRSGCARITVPASEDYIPKWVIDMMRKQEPDYAKALSVIAFELEVIKPGIVRVQGFWSAPEVTIIVTKDKLSFCKETLNEPLSIVGDGEGSVLKYTGAITSKMFEIFLAPLRNF